MALKTLYNIAQPAVYWTTTGVFVGFGVMWYKNNKSSSVVYANQIEELSPVDPDSIKSMVDAGKEHSWEKITARSATSVSSSVCGLVELTVTRCVECETLYHKYLQSLIDLLNAYVKAIGTPNAEELWDTIMFLRGFVAEVKDERRKLSLLWTNCQGLAEHAGQAAFHTGSDFSAYRLGEVVAAAELKLSSLSKLSLQLELQLAHVEAKEIKTSVQHEQNKINASETIEVIDEADS